MIEYKRGEIPMKNNKTTKICFVISSKEHFEELRMMQSLVNKYDSFIVADSSENIDGIRSYRLSTGGLIESLKIIMKENPDLIVSSGDMTNTYICRIMAKMGRKILSTQSFANVSVGKMTGKFMYKLTDHLYIQWHHLQAVQKVVLKGSMMIIPPQANILYLEKN